ncbi:MAG TPA: nicotinate-nucleotide adenylyltransferase [Candidatus Kapabacteria bacterium]|jgi:nicotinate-nucleotide adenylyltransferase
MNRIGMFGGTFDPPHLAHLIAGERAAEAYELDKLLFVPANVPPHKASLPITPAEHRLAMLRLAIEGNAKFEVSDLEMKRPSPSFTIDSLDEIKSRYGVSSIFLFIGFDQLAMFHSWKDYERILSENTVVAMNRPSFDIIKSDPLLRERVRFLAIPQLEISSTDIRSRVREGKSVRYFVPKNVSDYMEKHRLYQIQ